MFTITALVVALLQEIPPVPVPPEIPALWTTLVAFLASSTFGVVKFFSSKVRGLPDWAKMAIGLLSGFLWPMLVTLAQRIGLELPATIGALGDLSAWAMLIASVLGMGLRAITKSVVPTVSAAVWKVS